MGKTGAGKTAIVAALTGDPRAAVGQGFEACTQTAAFYDVPREVPLLRFLDTRGLGEADYDPAQDIAWCEDQSHLVLAVMQVTDPAQHTVLQILRQVRQRHPEWPVIVAQTGLHRLYSAGSGHPNPYPYTGGPEDEENPRSPRALRQALAYQRRLFDGLPGPSPRFLPVDFIHVHFLGASARHVHINQKLFNPQPPRMCSTHTVPLMKRDIHLAESHDGEERSGEEH